MNSKRLKIFRSTDAYMLVSWHLCHSGLQVRNVLCIESHLKRAKSAARSNHCTRKGKMASICNTYCTKVLSFKRCYSAGTFSQNILIKILKMKIMSVKLHTHLLMPVELKRGRGKEYKSNDIFQNIFRYKMFTKKHFCKFCIAGNFWRLEFFVNAVKNVTKRCF